MTRIVTSTYRYKRPPRKRKAVPLEGPAIVQRDVKPWNDIRPAGPKSRIVQAAKPKGRRKVWADDGQETPPEIKALIERMTLGRGPGST